MDLDNRPNSDMVPLLKIKELGILFLDSVQIFCVVRGGYNGLSIIFLFIGLVPLIILINIFDHTEADHEPKGKQKHGEASGVRVQGKTLHHTQNQEIHVCHLGKLHHQVQRQESEQIVL